jgi:hypothetical protein
MTKNTTVLSVSLILSAVIVVSVLAKVDFGTPAFAGPISPKAHLEEGIKALKAGDTQGALTHLNAADQGLSSSSSDQSAKMHLDEGIKALKANDNQGALMHLNAADQLILPNGSSSHFPINPT